MNEPRCGKCSKVMTPQNSRLRPELFYCDACLPGKFRSEPPMSEPRCPLCGSESTACTSPNGITSGCSNWHCEKHPVNKLAEENARLKAELAAVKANPPVPPNATLREYYESTQAEPRPEGDDAKPL